MPLRRLLVRSVSAVACGLALTTGCFFDESGIRPDDNSNGNGGNTNTNGNDNTNANAVCGNGVVEPPELCDDGNSEASDGCALDCRVEEGWQCPPGDPSVCFPVCGDHVVLSAHEECDDGNTDDEDGCSSLCEVEPFWSCEGDPNQCTCTVYVNGATGTGVGDGSRWSEPLLTVSAGVALAGDRVASYGPCQVWVAQGTYYVFKGGNADSIVLRNDVAVYGGFVGTETASGARDPELHVTVLDGSDGPSPTNRVLHVVSADNVSGAVLDGFTVTGGYIDSGDVDGAGLRAVASELTVARCRIVDNNNADDGAGLYAESCTLTLVDTEISNNASRDDGGGAVVRGVGSDATIERCIFAGNHSGDRGGGLTVHDGVVSVESSLFYQNTGPDAGGFTVTAGVTATVTNCTFSGNTATASPGGGIQNDGADLTVQNSILWGDAPAELDTPFGTTSVSYSDVQGALVFPGTGNINLPPAFEAAGAGDYRVAQGSPCIDAANAAVAPLLDLLGNPRVDDPATPDTGAGSPPTDMGAYELQP